MDETDRKLLNLIQQDFPIAAEPFAEFGVQLGISETDVLERIKRLKDQGIIRRIGAVFDLRKLHFVSALCAARVPEKKMGAFVAAVNAHPGVTHNYRRDHAYNVWFTLTAPDEEALAVAVDKLRQQTEQDELLVLRAVRTFKINVNFPL